MLVGRHPLAEVCSVDGAGWGELRKMRGMDRDRSDHPGEGPAVCRP